MQRNPTMIEVLRVYGPGETAPCVEPVYGDREYLSFPHHVAAALLTDLVDQTDAPAEWLPAEVLQHYGLPSFLEAVRRCHSPQEPGDCLPASRYRLRLAIDELVAANLRWRLAVREVRPARPIEVTPDIAARCLAATGFTSFTADQAAATAAIRDAFASPNACGLQVTGDVGTGKTALALIALVAAVESGRQAALMAPTTALVDQHVRTVGGWLDKLGISWVQLGGGQSSAGNEKARIKLQIGAARVVIGTHAVVTSDTEFADLGVAVIDETHRFGVDTRAALVAAADYTLQMSATPIPRSMAQVMDGTMKKAHLTQKPGGAPARETQVYGDEAGALDLIDREIAAGRNVFWVAPAIDENDDMASIAVTLAKLRDRYGEHVMELHGRLKAADIGKTLRAFNKAKGAIMVATTVIEVGVDVPHASVIVIEGADRFGLAQMHQLRGRVGRGKGVQGYCCLLTDAAPGSPAMARLKKMEQSQDGFELAAFDMAQRGSGDQLGVAQSGHRSHATVDPEAHAGLGDLASDICDWMEKALGVEDDRVQDLLSGFGDLAGDRDRLRA
jgi:ATP-dependent DNA helicase RecG